LAPGRDYDPRRAAATSSRQRRGEPLLSATPATRDPVVRRDVLLVALLAALVCLPGLGLRDLWNPDEARYAEVAREMRETGSWALPRLNDQVYTQKPPLFFWAIAAASLATGGVDETSARLPSALAYIGTAVLVFLLGQRLFGRRAAWLSAAVCATCFKVAWQGRFGQIDMLLTAWVALAMWCFVRGYTEKRQGFYWGFWAATGVATLTKGPAGMLPPLLAVVAFLLLSGERHELARLRIGRGLLLWAAVVVAWLIPAALAGGQEYLDHILLKQNLERYADPWHHFKPWYYFLTVIPVELMPWSLLLPALFAVRNQLAGDTRRGVRFALCWAVVTVVFFSLSPAKRSVYVLTMYPAMALLVGIALDRLADAWPRRRGWVVAPMAVTALFASSLVVAIGVFGGGRPELAPLGGPAIAWLAAGTFVPLALGAWWACWLAHRGRVARAAGALAGGMAAMWLAASLLVLPRFDVIKSARPMAAEVASRLRSGDVYGIYPRFDSAFLFYGSRPAVDLDTQDELREFAARPEHIWLVARRDDWGRVDPKPELVEVARDQDVKSGYLLLTRPETLARP
jgi:4-amino-4-deoxy-L-arabinose transferase-like glycosyltransferase